MKSLQLVYAQMYQGGIPIICVCECFWENGRIDVNRLQLPITDDFTIKSFLNQYNSILNLNRIKKFPWVSIPNQQKKKMAFINSDDISKSFNTDSYVVIGRLIGRYKRSNDKVSYLTIDAFGNLGIINPEKLREDTLNNKVANYRYSAAGGNVIIAPYGKTTYIMDGTQEDILEAQQKTRGSRGKQPNTGEFVGDAKQREIWRNNAAKYRAKVQKDVFGAISKDFGGYIVKYDTKILTKSINRNDTFTLEVDIRNKGITRIEIPGHTEMESFRDVRLKVIPSEFATDIKTLVLGPQFIEIPTDTCKELPCLENVVMLAKNVKLSKFAGMKHLQVVVVNNIQQIEERAFCNCGELRHILFDKMAKVIPAYAFYGCSKFNACEVIVPGVKGIRAHAFENTGTKAVVFPESFLSCDLSAFNGCTEFERVGILGPYTELIDSDKIPYHVKYTSGIGICNSILTHKKLTDDNFKIQYLKNKPNLINIEGHNILNLSTSGSDYITNSRISYLDSSIWKSYEMINFLKSIEYDNKLNNMTLQIIHSLAMIAWEFGGKEATIVDIFDEEIYKNTKIGVITGSYYLNAYSVRIILSLGLNSSVWPIKKIEEISVEDEKYIAVVSENYVAMYASSIRGILSKATSAHGLLVLKPKVLPMEKYTDLYKSDKN